MAPRCSVRAVGLLAGGMAYRGEQHEAPDLTVHEWGRSLRLPASEGEAVEWTPLSGTDLPQFVEHISDVTSSWGCGHHSHGNAGDVFLFSTTR